MRTTQSDVVLVGAGIMSATLGSLLSELDPSLKITVFEKQNSVATESSNEWNNAGTGHAALCELNYTPEKADGNVDCQKALTIYEKFQLSLQFWAYLVKQGQICHPQEFINALPHLSFVTGEKDVQFLKKRFETLQKSPLFSEMVFSQDPQQLAEWFPLIMQNRPENQPLAATYMRHGTDVNFGELTRKLFHALKKGKAELHLNHSVKDIQRLANGNWELTVQNEGQETFKHQAKFVFIGCGGGSLPLLQKSQIPEGQNIGGFPVSGIFLVCRNPDIVKQHYAKVYGKAKVGAPPMSVPHLDTRFINGEQTLLFGPFAGFTTKYLKDGSVLDFPTSITPKNFKTMMLAGAKNFSLTTYLIRQALLTKEERIAELREFMPNAKSEDWDVHIAGQRVQIIKDLPNEKGVLCFGTEVIHSADGSLAALLGASPGASTSVDTMLEVLEKCFTDRLPEWQNKLKAMMPSYKESLRDNAELHQQSAEQTRKMLGM